MAVVSRDRPTDLSGSDFLEMLGHLRRTRPPVATGLEEMLPVVPWVTGKHGRGDAPLQSATAETGGYRLLVVEMREAFMADEPLHAPKISWAIYYGSGEDDALVGAAAQRSRMRRPLPSWPSGFGSALDLTSRAETTRSRTRA